MMTYRDEEVWDPAFVFRPRLAVSFPASLDIPNDAVDNHGREENRIEPWEWRVEPCNQPPGKGEKPVASIVHFACLTVYIFRQHDQTLLACPCLVATYTIHYTEWSHQLRWESSPGFRCISKGVEGTSSGPPRIRAPGL